MTIIGQCSEYSMGNDVTDSRYGRCAGCEPAKERPGVDGITIQQIMMSDPGAAGFLEELQGALRTKTYQPQSAIGAVCSETIDWQGMAPPHGFCEVAGRR
jgi:hypothetical protein